tara:strand:+ start:2514 stop:2681 length:168 start_codon:yes stop_codon:yes gene_type:complete
MKRMWSQYYLEYIAFHGGEVAEAEELMFSASAYADSMTEINHEPIEDKDEDTGSN